jgi:hypothetical protein
LIAAGWLMVMGMLRVSRLLNGCVGAMVVGAAVLLNGGVERLATALREPVT